jgi:hypothetical protein
MVTINQHTNFELNRAKHSEVIAQNKQNSKWLPSLAAILKMRQS